MNKKLNPNADQGGEPSKNSFDPNAFKNEILESNKQMMTTLQSNVEDVVKTMLSKAEKEIDAGRTPPTPSDFKNDFASEMDDLNLDENQTKALMRMFDKAMDKKIPNWKNEVLSTVDDNLTNKDMKAQYDQEVLEKYPEAATKNSQLYQLASQIFSKMPSHVQLEPDAQANAVLKAASRLGIAPTSLSDIKSRGAANDTGEGPRRKSNAEPERAQIDFGVQFGNVSEEKFKEKLKLVNMGRKG